MITREDIERLARLKSDHGILSAYIRLDPRLRFLRRQALAQFKGALKKAEREIDRSRWGEALEREAARVADFLTNADFPGRALVIFSCRPEEIWETLHLDVLVPNLVDMDTTTKTAPLAEVVNASPRVILAVVQRDQARLYSARQRTTTEAPVDVASEVPGQHDQGGRSQLRFERHIEFHVAEHLKKVAEELKRLAAQGPFQLAIGGTDAIAEEMLQLLPEPIASACFGKFPVDYKQDTEQEILDRANALWQERERSAERSLVDQVFQAAEANRRGVLGAERTLDALMQEKVDTLVLASDAKIEGSVCTRCDYFSTHEFPSCPLCGGDALQRDLADRAVEKAMLTGARTEIVASRDCRERLLAAGGVGAILRY